MGHMILNTNYIFNLLKQVIFKTMVLSWEILDFLAGLGKTLTETALVWLPDMPYLAMRETHESPGFGSFTGSPWVAPSKQRSSIQTHWFCDSSIFKPKPTEIKVKGPVAMGKNGAVIGTFSHGQFSSQVLAEMQICQGQSEGSKGRL